MDVFKYRDSIVSDYRSFTTSFTKIKAPDILEFVMEQYDSGHYWPAPLIQLNPIYVAGQNVEQLVSSGKLQPACQDIFRFGRKDSSPGVSAQLYKHQQDAIDIAHKGESYVLTTGKGSGKSLGYILPIADYILKTKQLLAPEQYTPTDLDYIVPRVLKLTYTSHDLKPFAEDLGYEGEPFPFDPERRHQLKCELDAYYAKLYGLTRDELRYILDPTDVMGEDYPSETFRVLKKKELNEFGEYRTQRLVLEAWDVLSK